MTPDQVAQLKAGDPVEYRVRGLVHRVQYNFGHPNAVVLRRTSDAHGRQPLMLCALANVHLTPAIDPATATDAVILADWLDDQGESEAAHKLRQHFGPAAGLGVPGEETDDLLPTVLPAEVDPLSAGLVAADRAVAESTTWGSNTLVESQNRPEVYEELSEHAMADLEGGTY